MKFTLRPYQSDAVDAAMNIVRKTLAKVVLELATGCHEKGSGILMANGAIKRVEDVVAGDMLMGADGCPRRVIRLHRGDDEMYRITPAKGQSFTVNAGHILSLYMTPKRKGSATGYREISVKSYLSESNTFKHRSKLWLPKEVNFLSERKVEHPYMIGLLLGDGMLTSSSVGFVSDDAELLEYMHDKFISLGDKARIAFKNEKCSSLSIFSTSGKKGTRKINNTASFLLNAGMLYKSCYNKSIPDDYKFASKEDRMKLLAGLIDSDGHIGKKAAEYVSVSKDLANDVCFVARSLGFRALIKEKNTTAQNGFKGAAYRVNISGDLSALPFRREKHINQDTKRSQIKSHLVTGFKVEPVGTGAYFGFEIDGDHLYCDEQFFVHHNSGKSLVVAELANQLYELSGKKTLCLAPSKELITQNFEKYISFGNPASFWSASVGSKSVRHNAVFGTPMSVLNGIEYFKEGFACVVIDECHIISPTVKKIIREMKAGNPNLRVIGLTATPFRTGQGYIYKVDDKGLPVSEHRTKEPYFDVLAYKLQTQDVLDMGYLTRPVFGVPGSSYDAAGLKTNKRNQFEAHEVAEVFEGKGRLTSGIVQDVVNQADHRFGVMFFASSIAHSGEIAASLPPDITRIVTGKTPKKEREQTIKSFQSGDVHYLINVSVLCLDDRTEILTRQGWVGIDEISYDHDAACWDMDGSIRFAKPKFIVKRMTHTGERMMTYRGHNNFRVTEHHKMIVGTGANKRWEKKKCIELNGKSRCMPANGIAKPCATKIKKTPTSKKIIAARIRSLSYVYRKRGFEKEEAREMAEHHIMKKENFLYTNPSELSLSDCRFIGFWLADGTRNKDGSISIFQSLIYMNIINWFDNVLHESNIYANKMGRSSKQANTNDYIVWDFAKGTGGVGQFISDTFLRLDPYLDKKGSDLYWGLSIDQFDALLEGLWYGDGRHGTKGYNQRDAKGRLRHSVSSTQKELMDLLQAIGSCRGFRVSIGRDIKPRKINHSTQWEMSWTQSKRVHFPKKIEIDTTTTEQERVWCITSETGNIVTRRKGKVLVTGNTTGFDAPNVGTVAILRPTESPGLLLQIIGRGLRLFDGKDKALILDYAGNMERHQLSNDNLNPDIQVAGGGGDGTLIDAICPECDYTNEFTLKPDAAGYELDANGFIIDAFGKHINNEQGYPVAGHMGQRCRNEYITQSGVERCTYRFAFKVCESCETKNSLSSRLCTNCQGELINPNDKLTIKNHEKALKAGWQTSKVKYHNASTAKTSIRVTFGTDKGSVSVFISPASEHAWVRRKANNLLNSMGILVTSDIDYIADINSAKTPASIKWRKRDNGFYDVEVLT